MISQENVDLIISSISAIKSTDKIALFLEVVNIVALKLNAKCAEIYISDSSKKLALRLAGSGELGKRFDKYNRTRKLSVHNEFSGQVGPVIVLGEIRVVDWEAGKLFSYTLPSQLSDSFSESHKTVVTDKRPIYESPEFASIEDVYLPIRSKENNIGALSLHFDKHAISSTKDILLIQRIADFIGDIVS